MSRRDAIRPRYAGIDVPASFKEDAVAFAQAIKERLEQFTGDVGDPKQRFVTLRDLELAGIARIDVKGKYATPKGVTVEGNSASDVDDATLSVVSAFLAAGVGSANELPSNYQIIALDPQLRGLRRFNIIDLIGVRDADDPELAGLWTFDNDVTFNAGIFLGDSYGIAGDIIMGSGDEDSELPPTWHTPGDLTKTDDTNVTLTLGGDPTKALLYAVSLTLGWAGELAATRGGTSFGSYAAGDLLYASGTTSLAKLGIGSPNDVLVVSGGAPAWQSRTVLFTTPTITGVTHHATAYTVAGLAGLTPVIYDRTFATDALTPAFGAAVVGGGAVKVPVWYDGAAWIVG